MKIAKKISCCRFRKVDYILGLQELTIGICCLISGSYAALERNNPMNLECFVEDLFLGGQWSIILGYRRLSVKSLLVSWVLCDH